MDFTEISGTPFEAPHAPHVLTQVPPHQTSVGNPEYLGSLAMAQS